MYAEIAAAIQSAKSLGELVKAAKSLSNYQEVVAAVSEVSTKLMEATAVALQSQERESALLRRVSELERDLAAAKVVTDRAKNYVLHKFETGSLAYVQREEITDVPAHYVCVKCLDSGAYSKLQPHGNYALHCHTCGSKIQFKFTPPPSPPRVSRFFERDL